MMSSQLNQIFEKTAKSFQGDMASFHPFEIQNSFEDTVKQLRELSSSLPEIETEKGVAKATFVEENGPFLEYYIKEPYKSLVVIYPAKIKFKENWIWGFRIHTLNSSFFHCDINGIVVCLAYKLAPILKQEDSLCFPE